MVSQLCLKKSRGGARFAQGLITANAAYNVGNKCKTKPEFIVHLK